MKRGYDPSCNCIFCVGKRRELEEDKREIVDSGYGFGVEKTHSPLVDTGFGFQVEREGK